MTVRRGDRVLYCLDQRDAEDVNRRRDQFQEYQASPRAHGKHPHPAGEPGASGHVAHVGLTVTSGQWLPADVVLEGDGERLACLRVLLPGSDVQVVYSVPEGTRLGTWRQP